MRGVKSYGRLAHFGMLAHFAIDGCISLQASRAKFKQVHPSSIYHRRPAHHLIPGPINNNQTAYSSI